MSDWRRQTSFDLFGLGCSSVGDPRHPLDEYQTIVVLVRAAVFQEHGAARAEPSSSSPAVESLETSASFVCADCFLAGLAH